MVTFIDKPNLFSDLRKDVTQNIVVTVNCKGVMGAGVALEAKKLWPELAMRWREECLLCDKQAGKIYSYYPYNRILLATTKNDYRQDSKLEWVEAILRELSIRGFEADVAVGIPALGCGRGGLSWDKHVKDLTFDYLHNSKTNFVCYTPETITR